MLNGGTADGTRITLATYTQQTYQQFKFIANNDGSYRIVPRSNEGKAWTTSDTDGANVEIAANTQSDHQSGDGSTSIRGRFYD